MNTRQIKIMNTRDLSELGLPDDFIGGPREMADEAPYDYDGAAHWEWPKRYKSFADVDDVDKAKLYKIGDLCQIAHENTRMVGRALNRVKDAKVIPHREWAKYLEEICGFTGDAGIRRAQRWMSAAREEDENDILSFLNDATLNSLRLDKYAPVKADLISAAEEKVAKVTQKEATAAIKAYDAKLQKDGAPAFFADLDEGVEFTDQPPEPATENIAAVTARHESKEAARKQGSIHAKTKAIDLAINAIVDGIIAAIKSKPTRVKIADAIQDYLDLENDGRRDGSDRLVLTTLMHNLDPARAKQPKVTATAPPTAPEYAGIHEKIADTLKPNKKAAAPAAEKRGKKASA